MRIAEKFSDFTAELEFDRLPPSVVEKTKLLFLDWLGAAFVGAGEASTMAALQTAADLKGAEEATVLADMSRNSCIMAALVNGIGSHAVEMDDVHRQGIFHPGGPVFSAILPAAEKLNASGRQFIEAAVAGYEIGIRSAVAVGKSHYRYWHTTGTCGTFGAAAGTAKLLSLDRLQTAWALGSAGTQAAGLWEFLADNTMSKQLHPAKAAVNGMLAAFLSRRGLSGTGSIFEGEKGFFRATSTDFNLSAAIENLGGGSYKISESSIKKHASCGHTHSAIDAVLELIGRHGIASADISQIEVQIYDQALDLLGKVEPTTPFSAKFSLPFCIATAAVYKKVGLEAFCTERLNDPAVLNLMGCISLHRDPELTLLFPEKFGAVISIRTQNGGCFSERVDDPKGTPENPMSAEEIIDKYRQMALNRLGPKTDAILESVLKLDRLQSMNDLFAHV